MESRKRMLEAKELLKTGRMDEGQRKLLEAAGHMLIEVAGAENTYIATYHIGLALDWINQLFEDGELDAAADRLRTGSYVKGETGKFRLLAQPEYMCASAYACSPRDLDQVYSYSLTVTGCTNRIQLIKTLRKLFPLTLGEAKVMVDRIPIMIASGLTDWEANTVKEDLEKEGTATVVKSPQKDNTQ